VKVSKKVGLGELGQELQLLPQKISEATSDVLRLPWFEESAKSLCPVETSALLSSIRTEARGLHVVALVAGGGGFINPQTGREVDYARHVHDGTSRNLARPFLLQAVLLERARYLKEMLAVTAGMV
jgi:hypothetical protein